MRWLTLLICLLSVNSFAQKQFDITTLSPKFDVRLEVEKMDLGSWRGKTTISIFRKGSLKPFQIIRQKDTYVIVTTRGVPELAKVSEKRNGKWSAVYLEDLNFDGSEDLAVADGDNGGYRGISYRVYLYDKGKNKFVYSSSFTRLAQGPYNGIFEPDRKRKTISVFWKSTCCEHFSEDYKLMAGKPRLIGKVSEYYNLYYDGYTWTETKKLINGRWRTWQKREKNKS